MSTIKFTEDHEWIRMEDDGTATVGITDYAQDQLGDLVFVELPDAGGDINQGDEIAVIESVKAAGEIKSPASGNITAVNEALNDTPELINSDPTEDGWVFKMTVADAAELDGLMDEAAYAEHIAE